MKYAVLLPLIALIICASLSCRTIKTTTTQSRRETQADTIIHRETVRLDTLRALADSVKISIPVMLLSDTGINYLERSSGRAKVTLQRTGNTIYVSARCDSLEKVIASRERELVRLRNTYSSSTTTEKRVITKSPFWQMAWLYGSTALLLLIIIQYFIKILNPLQWLKSTLARIKGSK